MVRFQFLASFSTDETTALAKCTSPQEGYSSGGFISDVQARGPAARNPAISAPPRCGTSKRVYGVAPGFHGVHRLRPRPIFLGLFVSERAAS